MLAMPDAAAIHTPPLPEESLFSCDLEKYVVKTVLAYLEKSAALLMAENIGNERIRLSTHVHTRPQDLDLFFETVAETRKG